MYLKKTYFFADNVQLLTACRMSTPQLFASCTLAGSSVFKKVFGSMIVSPVKKHRNIMSPCRNSRDVDEG